MDYTFTSQVVFLDRSVRAAVFFMMYYLLLTYAYCLILVHVRKYFSAITSLIFEIAKMIHYLLLYVQGGNVKNNFLTIFLPKNVLTIT
jgi:hypothetical protein